MSATPEAAVHELRSMIDRANELEARIRKLQGTIEAQARAFQAAVMQQDSNRREPLTASPDTALRSN
jgi:TolA-binding protein